MDELITTVSERTGLSEEKARDAAQTVIRFLKDRLPAPVASQVDQALGGPLGGVVGKI